MKLAIIGGTGVYDPDMLSDLQEVAVETVYGSPVPVVTGKYAGKEVVFLSRHGSKHSVPPHKINYRANIAALKKLGVQRVLATAAVGSLNPAMESGHLALVDQFIDFTKDRKSTYYDGGEAGVVHTDFTEPYCIEMRDILSRVAKDLNIRLHSKSTYVCAEGPRFETPAEIKMFRQWGSDLVGMTGVPEVVLARELGLCYNTIALVTNFAAGISPEKLTHQEVLEAMAANIGNVKKIMQQFIRTLPDELACDCSSNYTAILGEAI